MRIVNLEDAEKILVFVVIFLIGFTSSLLFSPSMNFETPFSLTYNSTNLKIAPNDVINQEDILIYPDKVVIKVSGASMSSYEPTGSMIPILDEGTNGIRIKPESEENINVGDIVSFRLGNSLIVHRVIEKGVDEEGIYFITKGDNNTFPDEKIRFKDIEYITIAFIY